MPKKDVSWERFGKWINNHFISGDMFKDNLDLCNDVSNKMVYGIKMLSSFMNRSHKK
jgi:hypothetical protein